ncbi:FHA domain-containing protein [Paramicrobacterium fandaimingii]|uniref:FHA domain-containing protein n=1 Tax=Paramicrobacterium fandaimingii TaxID=2708079 RepID=UPI00142210BF|nr:FHA domain-containing protein [Microbacterium fandaimingii]
MSADDTWNGVPLPPRPPLPPLPDQQEDPPSAPDSVTRPGFIGLPPGMQADIDTVPASADRVAPAPVGTPSTPDGNASDIDIEFADGTRIPIDGIVLIGRDPSAQTAFPDAELRAVSDVSRSVSKTHAAVQWSRGAVWVTDLHSTNGTRIVDAAGRETVCVPDAPTPAPRDGGILFGRALASLRARSGDGSE